MSWGRYPVFFLVFTSTLWTSGLVFVGDNVDTSDGRMDAAWTFSALTAANAFWIGHDRALFGMRHEPKSF